MFGWEEPLHANSGFLTRISMERVVFVFVSVVFVVINLHVELISMVLCKFVKLYCV
jgi:hypothetical protein